MKKIYSFLFAAVALMSAASCQKELVNDNAPVAEGEKFTITAVADAQTKTALASDGKNSEWTPGDAIAVFDASGNGAEFTTDITANQASAKFTCETFDAPESFVALYPYQADLTLTEGTVSGLEFPAAQQALAGGFDKDAAFTFATGNDKDNLEFNNLYSLLKVTIAEDGITEVTVSATSGSLAGKVTLDSADGTFTVVDGQGSSSVTLTGEFTKDATYYICVLPGEYEGFSIALNGYTVRTKGSAAIFAANEVYDLGEVKILKTSVYLRPRVWATANPVFSVLYDEITIEMNKTEEGYYTVAIPSSVEKFTFQRRDPSNTATIWNSIETDLPSDDKVYFTVDDTWNAGTWGVKPADKVFSIVGAFNNWGGAGADIPMEKVKAGLYAAKSVTQLTAFAEWKIRVNNDWDESYTSSITGIEANKWVSTGGSDNTSVASDGEYDIYLDVLNDRIYVMETGVDYSTAVQQTTNGQKPLTDTWYLVGSFNSWTPGDEDYKMSVEGQWYVFKGLTLDANDEVKVCDGTWDVNRGGSFAGVDQACAVTPGGSNIKVTTAGTYDVYLNSAEDMLYFMTSGNVPAN